MISRGYGGSGPFPALVNPHSSAAQVGDEPCLIVQATHAPMAVGANRQASIELLLQQQPLDLIISDDGLQHWALERDLEWIVLDLNRGLGNQQLLPEGFLRELFEPFGAIHCNRTCSEPHNRFTHAFAVGCAVFVISKA